MIKFYYNTSPNPMKITLCLEEMDLSYEAIPIDTRKGDQHSDSFKAINPNAKAPAIKMMEILFLTVMLYYYIWQKNLENL